MLDRDPETRTLNVHRLVQTVLAAEMDGEERARWSTHAIRALDAAFPIPEYTNWPLCERLVPHALACAEHLRREGIELVELGHLLSMVAVYLRQRGRRGEAMPLQTQAVSVLKRTAGDGSMPLAWALHNLSALKRDHGSITAAAELAGRATAIAERELVPSDPELTFFLANLAMIARRQRRPQEAERLLERSVRNPPRGGGSRTRRSWRGPCRRSATYLDSDGSTRPSGG